MDQYTRGARPPVDPSVDPPVDPLPHDEVPVLWSPETRRHDPQNEVWIGVATIGTEVAARVDTILDALSGPGFRAVEVAARSERSALESVHDPAMLEHLRTASDRWAAGPYE